MRVASAWRPIALGAIAAAGIGSILASGGGKTVIGGVASGAHVLPTYDYGISPLPAGSMPLTASVTLPDGNTAAISIDLGSGVTGTVDTAVNDTGDIALPTRSIAAGTSLQIDSDAGVPLLGTFRVDVATDLQFAATAPPSAGALDIVAGGDTVHATIGTGGSADLSLNGAAPVPFTWDAVSALWPDTTAPEWQRRASLGLALLDLVYVRALASVDALNAIHGSTANDYPLRSDCDAFQKPPPFGVLVQGSSTLTWLGSGRVQPGDDFHRNFVDCWRNDAVASDLLNGGEDLNGYTRVIDSSHDYTRLGFEPSQGVDGGMVFDDLAVDNVQQDSLGRYVTDRRQRFTLSGGFAVVFSAP